MNCMLIKHYCFYFLISSDLPLMLLQMTCQERTFSLNGISYIVIIFLLALNEVHTGQRIEFIYIVFHKLLCKAALIYTYFQGIRRAG